MKWLAWIFLFHLSAHAGYRAYVLRIYELDRTEKKIIKNHVVFTTLDPFQYDAYYKFSYPTRIRLVDTWFCPGDTANFRRPCERPKVKGRAPSSFNAPKRTELPYNRQPIIP